MNQNNKITKTMVTALIFTSSFIITLSYFFYTKDYLTLTAWQGYSPIGWINYINNPTLLALDYPGGNALYEKSLLMWGYILLDPFIHTFSSIKIYFIFEYLIWILALYLVAKHLKLNGLQLALFITISLFVIVATTYRDTNVGRWGQSSFNGLFYNYVDAARIISIVLLFQSKIKLHYILNTLILFCHPASGVMTWFLTITYQIIYIKRPNPILTSVILFILNVGIYYALFLYNSSTENNIPQDKWFLLTEAFNYHWYPVQLGVFSKIASLEFLPFLYLLSYCFLISIIYKNESKKLPLPIFFLVFSSLFLCCIGIINSYFQISVPLTKIALQRANDLPTSFMLFFIIFALINASFSQRKNYFLASYSLCLLFILCTGALYNSIIFYLVLIITIMLFIHQKKYTLALQSLIPFVFVGGFSAYLFCFNYTYLTRSINSTQLFFVLSALTGLLWFQSKFKRYFNHNLIFVLSLSALIIFSSYRFYDNKKINNEKLSLMHSYYDVQVWANNNTDPSDLFWTPPDIVYGWSDISQRASFGTPRKWLHTGWTYSSIYSNYIEGITRTNILLKEDVFKFFEKHKAISRFEVGQLISTMIKENFNSLTTESLLSITNTYKIKYVIFNKADLKIEHKLPKIYENNDFIVLKL